MYEQEVRQLTKDIITAQLTLLLPDITGLEAEKAVTKKLDAMEKLFRIGRIADDLRHYANLMQGVE